MLERGGTHPVEGGGGEGGHDVTAVRADDGRSARSAPVTGARRPLRGAAGGATSCCLGPGPSWSTHRARRTARRRHSPARTANGAVGLSGWRVAAHATLEPRPDRAPARGGTRGCRPGANQNSPGAPAPSPPAPGCARRALPSALRAKRSGRRAGRPRRRLTPPCGARGGLLVTRTPLPVLAVGQVGHHDVAVQMRVAIAVHGVVNCTPAIPPVRSTSRSVPGAARSSGRDPRDTSAPRPPPQRAPPPLRRRPPGRPARKVHAGRNPRAEGEARNGRHVVRPDPSGSPPSGWRPPRIRPNSSGPRDPSRPRAAARGRPTGLGRRRAAGGRGPRGSTPRHPARVGESPSTPTSRRDRPDVRGTVGREA